jgi:hypothetical protein
VTSITIPGNALVILVEVVGRWLPRLNTDQIKLDYWSEVWRKDTL